MHRFLRRRWVVSSLVLLVCLIGASSLVAQRSTLLSSKWLGRWAVQPVLQTEPARAFALAPVVEAQEAVPLLATDRTGYLPGMTVQIAGTGFGALEEVSLQVRHKDAAPDCTLGHAPWTVQASEAGEFSATWDINGEDVAGYEFVLTATSQAGTLSAEFSPDCRALVGQARLRAGRRGAALGPGLQAGGNRDPCMSRTSAACRAPADTNRSPSRPTNSVPSPLPGT